MYKESLERTEEQATTYNNLGKIHDVMMVSLNSLSIAASLYGETKRFKESEAMFWKALELNPHYTEAYFNLGI